MSAVVIHGRIVTMESDDHDGFDDAVIVDVGDTYTERVTSRRGRSPKSASVRSL